MRNFVLCFSFFFLSLCTAFPDNEKPQNWDYIIQEILEENKVLKERLDVLQDRFTVLEEKCACSGKSTRGETNPESEYEEENNIVQLLSSDIEHPSTTDFTANLTSGITPGISVGQGHGHLLKRISESEVAFHAYLSGDRCYNHHEIFIFDRAPVNVGNGFNVNDGIFDAPATGIYVLSWTVAAIYGSWFSAELIINGVVQGVIESDSDVHGSGIGIHPATGLVLANVNAGNHIYIRYIKGTGCSVRSNSYTRTSFTGWLLI